MFFRDVAQLGSALRSGRRGRWFESSHPDWYLSIAKLFVRGDTLVSALPNYCPIDKLFARQILLVLSAIKIIALIYVLMSINRLSYPTHLLGL